MNEEDLKVFYFILFKINLLQRYYINFSTINYLNTNSFYLIAEQKKLESENHTKIYLILLY